ncbi:MAG: hypothetical protein WDN67_00980 [Candidatus Moraniibacteriota bacterium]
MTEEQSIELFTWLCYLMDHEKASYLPDADIPMFIDNGDYIEPEPLRYYNYG